jgi:hypothetical protein
VVGGLTSAWDDGETRLGQSDCSRGSQDTEVCAEAQLKTAAKGCAANGRDGGDWECRQAGESAPQLCQELGDAVHLVSAYCHLISNQAYNNLLLFRRHAQSLLQVGASTKGIVRLAGQDQSSCAAFAALLVQALYDSAQFTQQLCRDCIAGFGAVER